MRLFLIVLVTYNLMIEKSDGEIIGCDFVDTVNITESTKLSNGSYIYEDLLIPDDLTGEYDFILMANGLKEKVDSHIRGCVCKLKTCIRFCCPHDNIMYKNVCYDNMSKNEMKILDPFVNITLNNGSVTKMHFKNDLIVQWGFPMACNKTFFLDVGYNDQQYTIFENGTFQRHFDGKVFNKHNYCFQHQTFNVDGAQTIRMAPFNCEIEPDNITGRTVVLIISMTSLALTTTIYLVIKKLRILIGKCLICYMISLFFGFLFYLLQLWDLSEAFCTLAAYMGYFFVIAAFFWLSVISQYLCKNMTNSFKSIKCFSSERPFIGYSCYAWGIPMAMTGIVYLADKVVENQEIKPNMGEQCWISTEKWSAMIYFFGPMLILIVLNTIMFVTTAFYIFSSKSYIRNTAMKDGRDLKLKSDKRNYTVFLMLFIAMGVSWIFEIISYTVQDKETWARVFLVADYVNWSQGIFIFVLFILKPSTLKLIKNEIFPNNAWRSSMRSRATQNSIVGCGNKRPTQRTTSQDSSCL
ncbi:probable G-protein coupled receptor Mth-like 2 [Drosophila eugracilis]|uniref:probable G-protein coupled receptor Mth-like 2 n=1 Tax=Drosophila eugracilis TaxID=29029 RepID=UPI0007E681C5|nr:probable G-protein coupled receptor Mth-like 2 [Drosophila eugracilis]